MNITNLIIALGLGLGLQVVGIITSGKAIKSLSGEVVLHGGLALIAVIASIFTFHGKEVVPLTGITLGSSLLLLTVAIWAGYHGRAWAFFIVTPIIGLTILFVSMVRYMGIS